MGTSFGQQRELGTATEAEAYRKSIRERLPAVPSAYVPSGIMPGAAVLWMGAGALLAGPAGAVAAIVCAVVTALLVVLLHLVNSAMSSACGRVLCWLIIAEIVVGLAGAVLTFMAAGAAPAFLVSRLGRLGKNRSTAGGALFAIGGSVGAYALLVLTVYFLGAEPRPDAAADGVSVGSLAAQVSDLGVGTWIVLGLGLVITIGSAGVFGADFVRGMKFCEACAEYMSDVGLNGLGWEGGSELLSCAGQGDGEAMALRLATDEGRDVETKLYSCPRCDRGYVESHAHFSSKWTVKANKTDTKTETWLFLSRATADVETRLLQQRRRTS